MAEIEPTNPTPADALTSATDLPTGSNTKVSLFAKLPLETGWRGFDLNPAGGLANDFRETAQAFAKRMLDKKTLVSYVAGRMPDEYEVAWLPRVDVSEIGPVLVRAEAAAPMEVFDPNSADAKHLRLLVISIRTRTRPWIHFVRETSIRARLARSGKIAVIMRNGVYDRLESDVLLFDTVFDAIVAQGLAFIVNQRQFERSVGFTEGAGAAATATLKAVSAKLRIRNYNSLLAAAASDTNMIAKLRGIQAKMNASAIYAEAMTMSKLVPFIKDNPQLQIDLEGPSGQEELVFYADPPRRWRVLKLLDDDYLYSKLTEINYEANSKTALK